MVICPASPHQQQCTDGEYYCCTLQGAARDDESGGKAADAKAHAICPALHVLADLLDSCEPEDDAPVTWGALRRQIREAFGRSRPRGGPMSTQRQRVISRAMLTLWRGLPMDPADAEKFGRIFDETPLYGADEPQRLPPGGGDNA